VSGSDDRRDEARRIADDFLDYAIYAPLGAVLTLAEGLPELVRRGRERFGPRLALAQMLGKVVADSARRRAGDVLRHPGGASGGDAAPAHVPADRAEADLPIPGYELLPAAEIVARLPGLTRRELDAVRDYEVAHRARRTVLTRIGQLLGEKGQ